MNKWLFAALLLSIVNTTYACGKRPVASAIRQDGTKYGLFITEKTIKESKQWTPAQGEPPLSFTAAYKHITTWAQKKYKRYDKINVNEIRLKKYRCSTVKDYWYYQIDITPIIEGNELWELRETTAVLMNGKIIGQQKY